MSTAREIGRWTIEDWNSFLVELFFHRSHGATRELRVLDATEDFLAKELGFKEGNEKPHKLFLGTFRDSLVDLSKPFSEAEAWSPEQDELPFFYELYFSLIAASATEDTQEIGQFRDRVSELLELNSHPNEENILLLRKHWERAETWSKSHHEVVTNRLVLPDQRHETRIGYSKRLAFPAQVDRSKLGRLLAESHLDSQSDPRDIIAAIEKVKSKFSKGFIEEFDLFKKTLLRGRKGNACDSPFWSVVQSARLVEVMASAGIKINFEIDVCDPVTLICLFAGASTEQVEAIRKAGWISDEALNSEYATDTRYFPGKGESSQDRFIEDLKSLGIGESQFPLPHLNEGILCFVKEGQFTWRSRKTLPSDEGEPLILIVNEENKNNLLNDLKPIDFFKISTLSGWWCSSQKPCKDIAKLTERFFYKELSALKQGMDTRPFSLFGNIRQPGGILLRRNCLPEVRADTAHKVTCTIDKPGPVGLRKSENEIYQNKSKNLEGVGQFKLAQCEGGVFQFAPGEMPINRRESKLTFRAYDQHGHVIQSKRVTGFKFCINYRPQKVDGARWLGEQTLGQLGDPNATDAKPKANEQLSRAALSNLQKNIVQHRSVKDGITDSRWEYIAPDEIHPQWLDLYECLSAKDSNQKLTHISFDELEKLLVAGFGTKHCTSTTVELLCQNGHLRRVYNRHWRGIRYCAEMLEARIVGEEGKRKIQVRGLLNYYLRNRLGKLANDLGCSLAIASFNKQSALGFTLIEGERIDDLISKFRDEADLCLRFSEVQEMDELTGPASLLSYSVNHGGARDEMGTRYWTATSRYSERLSENESGYVLTKKTFDRRNPVWSLSHDSKKIWSTEVDSWALFLISCLSNTYGPNLVGSTIRTVYPLPETISRELLFGGSGVCGYAKTQSGREWQYLVPNESRFRDWCDGWGLVEANKVTQNSAVDRWASAYEQECLRTNLKSEPLAFRRRFDQY